MSPEALREIARNMVETVPQASALGFKLYSIEPSRGSILTPWREDLVGDPDTGVIAGGVITALLDHACGLATISMATDSKTPFSTATLDLRIDYMRAAAPGQKITARATCYHVTRSVAFVRAQAMDEDTDNPVATATGAFTLER